MFHTARQTKTFGKRKVPAIQPAPLHDLEAVENDLIKSLHAAQRNGDARQVVAIRRQLNRLFV